MIRLATEVLVRGVTAIQVCEFMIECDDARYHAWWPEAHFKFHTVKREPGIVGSVVYFDERVGRRRLRFRAVVTEYVPERRIRWQMKAGVLLPAWLTLDLEETTRGLRIVHALSVGFREVGRVLDPLLRLYLSRRFEADLAEHAQTEFTKLAALLGR